MAICHSGHEEPQPQPISATGDETKRCVTLEHWVLCRSHPVHLEVVIHKRERAHPDCLRTLGQVGDARSDAFRAASPVES
jgi:hypothetical protein